MNFNAKALPGVTELLTAGAVCMALAVVIGAFGAHGLKNRLSDDMMQVYQTGVEYHLAHGLGILMIAVIAALYNGNPLILKAGWVMAGGVLLFSGSLYALAITGIKPLGAITPIGGLAFIAGWGMLAFGLIKQG